MPGARALFSPHGEADQTLETGNGRPHAGAHATDGLRLPRRDFVRGAAAALLTMGQTLHAGETAHQKPMRCPEEREDEPRVCRTADEWYEGKGREWGKPVYHNPELQRMAERIRAFAEKLNAGRGPGYHKTFRGMMPEMEYFLREAAAFDCYPFPPALLREARANRDLESFLRRTSEKLEGLMEDRMLPGSTTMALAADYIRDIARIPLRVEPEAAEKLAEQPLRIMRATSTERRTNATWEILARILREGGVDLHAGNWELKYDFPCLDPCWYIPAGPLVITIPPPHASSQRYESFQSRHHAGLRVTGTFTRMENVQLSIPFSFWSRALRNGLESTRIVKRT